MMGGTATLELETYQSQTELYFLFRGRIVLDECEKLRSTCLPMVGKGIETVMVDLAKVDFIDSAGLGLLVGFKMTASKSKARIMLVQPAKPVADILYVSKLDGIFEVVNGAAGDALRARMMQPGNKITPGQAPSGMSSMGGLPSAGEVAKAGGVSADWMNSKLDTAFSDSAAATSRPPAGPAAGMSSSVAPKGSKEIVEEHCRKAVEYMRQGNYDMSVSEYNEALELDPDYLPALNNLAIVYEKQPSWAARAIETWDRVLRISQDRGDSKHTDRAQRHLANLRQMNS